MNVKLSLIACYRVELIWSHCYVFQELEVSDLSAGHSSVPPTLPPLLLHYYISTSHLSRVNPVQISCAAQTPAKFKLKEFVTRRIKYYIIDFETPTELCRVKTEL